MGTRMLHNMKSKGLAWILALAATGLTGCSGGGDSSPPATTASVLQVTPSNPTLAPGASVAFTVTGGTAPYYFFVVSASGGTFLSNVYTAPATLVTNPMAVTIQIQDSASNSIQLTVNLSTTAATGLAISPIDPTVAPSGTIPFSATGGTPPYTYQVLTSGGGSFSGSLYTAPATAMNATVQVTDSKSATSQTVVSVTNTTSTLSCEGTYNLLVSGGSGTLTIIQDANGNIAGSITNVSGSSNSAMPISGTCSISSTSGTISFTNLSTGSDYTGTIYEPVGSSSTQLLIYGTYKSGSSTYNWSAQEQ